MIRKPCHSCKNTHVARSIAARLRDLRVTTVHPASLNASRSSGGELTRQVSSPSAVGHEPFLHLGTTSRGVQSLRTRSIGGLFCFLWPFLHFFHCICFSPWVFLNGSPCLLRLRPRLAIARHILRCALPLASGGGILGPLTLFTFSFAPSL